MSCIMDAGCSSTGNDKVAATHEHQQASNNQHDNRHHHEQNHYQERRPDLLLLLQQPVQNLLLSHLLPIILQLILLGLQTGPVLIMLAIPAHFVVVEAEFSAFSFKFPLVVVGFAFDAVFCFFYQADELDAFLFVLKLLILDITLINPLMRLLQKRIQPLHHLHILLIILLGQNTLS